MAEECLLSAHSGTSSMAKARILSVTAARDAEIADQVPFEAEQNPRLRWLKYVRILRDELVRLLSEEHEVLLIARCSIRATTGRSSCCAGWGLRRAVLLLSEDAIKSKWVLQEATVLTWRRRLREDFRLIPAMLGGLQFKAL